MCRQAIFQQQQGTIQGHQANHMLAGVPGPSLQLEVPEEDKNVKKFQWSTA